MKKSVALVIVWGITIVICLLALGGIYLMGNQSFVAEHKIKRMQAYYTAKSGVIKALEELRRGQAVNGTYVSLNQSSGNMTADITVENITSGAFQGLKKVNVTVDYSR